MRIVFMGSPEFALPSLEAVLAHHDVTLVITQPDKPAGRGKGLSAPPVKQRADAAGVAIYQPPSARRPEVAERLRATGAELAVVVAYGKILPLAVLEAFPKGCVNVHASVLPAYRGAAPIQWAIIRGETETGVTIMQLDEGMDTGPMLLVKREPIRGEDTAGTLSERLAALGAEALIETLAAIEAGTARAVPQDDSRASYAPILKKEDGRVDWSRPAREVRDRIRGVDPWPGATAAWEGAPLKLFGAALADAVPPGSPRTPTLPVDQDLIIGGAGAPGQVQAVGPAGLVVVCGEGAVRIAELQAPGRRRMPAADLARGRRLSPGVVLA